MTTLTEGMHEGEFIGELAMGIGYHVDPVTVLSGENLVAGTVVGKQTSGGKYVAYDNAGTDDGRRAVAGIIVADCNASAADKAGKVLVRGPAIINKNDLVWAAGIDAGEQATAITAMLALGIKAV
jgi:hypothetical protein